jgi:4-amino-4-deoxy-L-arabinose transferase-like glycosyltransferase
MRTAAGMAAPQTHSALSADTRDDVSPNPAPRAARVTMRRVASFVIAFVIALVVLSQGITAPFQKDQEPQSAEWAADIVNQGHWLLPHDYYGFVDRKPPLFYWLTALVVKAGGGKVTEARVRAVSLIAGAALAAEVMMWTAANVGEGQGWLAFFFLLGTYGFASRATNVLTDMLMTLLLWSAYCLLRPQLDGSAQKRGTLAAGLIMGLAFLTKGPVTISLLALAAFIYLLLMRSNPFAVVRRLWPWEVLALAVGIALLWYVPAFIAGRSSGLASVFVDENFGHLMPAAMGGTGEAARPVYYIVMRLFGSALPLSFLTVPLAIAFARGEFAVELRKPLLFQLAMALAVVLLFSVASSKRDDYILPALPPLAILFASLFSGKISLAGGRHGYASIVRDITASAIAVGMLIGVIAALLFFRVSDNAGPLASNAGWLGSNASVFGLHLQSPADASYAAIFAHGVAQMSPAFVIFIFAVAAGAIVTLIGLMRRRQPLSTGVGLATICLAGVVLWTATLRPEETATRSLAKFAPEVRERVGAAPIYAAYADPELAYYYGSAVPPLPQALAHNGPMQGQTIYFIARPPDLLRLAPSVRHGLKVILESNLLGGGGPPVLYLMQPVSGTGLNDATGSAK